MMNLAPLLFVAIVIVGPDMPAYADARLASSLQEGVTSTVIGQLDANRDNTISREELASVVLDLRNENRQTNEWLRRIDESLRGDGGSNSGLNSRIGAIETAMVGLQDMFRERRDSWLKDGLDGPSRLKRIEDVVFFAGTPLGVCVIGLLLKRYMDSRRKDGTP